MIDDAFAVKIIEIIFLIHKKVFVIARNNGVIV